MTPAEERALRRAAVLLLVSGLLRWGWETHRSPPAFAAQEEDRLPELVEQAREMRLDAERRSRPLAPDERLDPNRAGTADLDRLPGVGPATAEAIVAARETRGGFGGAADLLEVRGIGPATLARIEPHLDFSSGMPVALRRPLGSRTPDSRTPETWPDPRPPDPLDLNRADAAALEALPGIGPALAARIVAAREGRGGFQAVDDLLEVRGIGPVSLERLRPLVRVGRGR